MPKYIPSVGDQVTVSGGGSTWTVLRISPHHRMVYLYVPGTNLERSHVPFEELRPVPILRDQQRKVGQRQWSLEDEEFHERLITAQHHHIEQLCASVVALKVYLERAGVSPRIKNALDRLCATNDETWEETVREIIKLMDS